MHIAYFTNAYHPVISGVVRSVDSFRKALSQNGHNVFIFTHSAEDFVDTQPFIFRYPTIPIHLPSDFPATLPISPFIDRVFPILKPQVIHTHHPVLLGDTAANKAKTFHLPLVFTYHTNYQEYSHYFSISREKPSGLVKDTIEFWIADFIKNCQHMIVPTHTMKDQISRIYGIDNEDMSVIPTGIELEPFLNADRWTLRKNKNWDEEKKILISVGRLSKEKSFDKLLKAFALVHHEQPETLLILIGDGPEKENLISLAQDLNISAAVEFSGKQEFAKIPAFLKAADIFVFASTSETQGLVTIEAMAAGLPVVAVHATGTVDAVEDQKQGFLTADHPKALAEGILTLLKNKQKQKEFSEAALKRAAAYDMQALTQELEEVYRVSIQKKQAGKSIKLKGYDNILEFFGLTEWDEL